MTLCAFFAMGVFVGAKTERGQATDAIEHGLRRVKDLSMRLRHLATSRGLTTQSFPAALVRQGDRFYVLESDGRVSGPVSETPQSDVPILAGSAVENASGQKLVEYAALAVRAEAALSQTVSEVRVEKPGLARLYLADFHTEVILDTARASSELERAAQVIRRWRGREQLLAAIDVTPEDEAVVSLRVPPRATARVASVDKQLDGKRPRFKANAQAVVKNSSR